MTSQVADHSASSASERGEALARYPNNNLGPQVREVKEVPSLYEVVRTHFAKAKDSK